MKPLKPVAVAAALAVLFSGCSLFRGPAASSAPASSSSAAQSGPPASSSRAASSPANPSSGAVSPGGPSESQPGRVLTVTTDSRDFNEKFRDNPVDKAYIAESDKAVSTADMVRVSEKYAELWEKEIAHAMDGLEERAGTDSGGKFAKLKEEQKSWEDGRAAALKKISDDATAAGGSMARVNEAGGVMDFYRGRAARLYRALYDYDKNYSYAFSAD